MINISYCYFINICTGSDASLIHSLTPHSSLLIPHSSFLTPHASLLYPFPLGNTILNLVPVAPLEGSLFDSALICPLCIFTTP
jgi:hypothetical protein